MAILLSSLALGSAYAAGGTSDELDLVLLLDKSLSMAPFFPLVRSFVVSSLVKPLLLPGDRLVLELVYGKQDRLFSGRIGSEDDKDEVIRAVETLRADGRYTDLGAALDRAVELVLELGDPERPKYVLLVTDERQEAPGWSRYAVADFKLRHPLLRYAKRRDLGNFRLLSVGIGIEASVDAKAPLIMRYLGEPRSTESREALEESYSLAAPSPLDSAVNIGSAQATGEAMSSEAAPEPHADSGADPGSDRPGPRLAGTSTGDRAPLLPAWVVAVGLAALAAAAIALILIKKRK
jgi:hypothetical protein